MRLLHSGSRRGEAGVLPGDNQSADGRATRLRCAAIRSAGPARGEPTSRVQRQEWDAEV